LDVDGAVEKAKLDEFRISNAALTSERDAFKQRFDGIDPDEVGSLRTATMKAAEEAQLKAGEVEKVLESRNFGKSLFLRIAADGNMRTLSFPAG
jgi:hypothetical protein